MGKVIVHIVIKGITTHQWNTWAKARDESYPPTLLTPDPIIIYEEYSVWTNNEALLKHLNIIREKQVTKQQTKVRFSKPSCDICRSFYSQGPVADQPYPEFACMKGHWDGINSFDSLSEPVKCKDFKLNF